MNMKNRWNRIFCFAALCICVAGLLCCCGRRQGEQEMKRYTFVQEIRELELDVGGAEVRFLKNKDFAVETDNPYIAVKAKGGVLTVREEPHIDDLESSVVLIYLPNDVFFDRVELKLGAGRLEGIFLNCGSLELDLGAGEMQFSTVQVSGEADITGGVGAVQICELQAGELELKLGVGECVIELLSVEHTDLEAGVGNLQVTLAGSPADYTFRAERGLGGITVDGEDASNGTQGSGPKWVEITGGIGNVDIRFEGE